MEQLICPRCGERLTAPACPKCTDKAVFRIVQRELVLLVLLGAITVPLFLFTRSMAARNRAMSIEVAGAWFGLGQEELKSGNTDDAIDSFRKAATSDHDNPEYTLALARALAAADHPDEARQILLRLRIPAPENGEINLNLARLAAREGMIGEAVRYYHNALYGIWPADELAGRRTTVRSELVRFLLSAQNTSRALSELLILSSDIPDTEDAHEDLGRLFLAAGDSQHALEQFKHALRLDAKSAGASSGAGRASFELADYATARRYLEAAIANGDKSEPTAGLLNLTRLVLSKDPLAPRLATTERIRRLVDDLNVASNGLQSCIAETLPDPSSFIVLEPLQEEIDWSMQTELAPADLRKDPEGFRTGLNLIYRIESAINQICEESSFPHRALLLIARKHGLGDQ